MMKISLSFVAFIFRITTGKSSFQIIVNETHVSVRPLSHSITDSITDNKLPIFVKPRASVRDKIQGKWKSS